MSRLFEQRRIVAQVEQRMAWVDALETQLAAARAIAALRGWPFIRLFLKH